MSAFPSIPDENPFVETSPPALDEKEDLLLRLALTERKLALATQKLGTRNQELEAIHRLAEAIGNERHINRLCERTAEEICRTLGATTACILLLDEPSGDLITAACAGTALPAGHHPRVRSGEGLLWQVIKTGKPLHLPGNAAMTWFTGAPQANQEGVAVPIRTQGRSLGAIYVCGRQNGQAFSVRQCDVLCGIASQTAVALDNTTLNHDLENLFVGIAWAFASVLDAKSPWTAGHSKRVTQYAVAIAEELGQGPEFLNTVQTCGLLHDIGKIAVPEKILDKPSAITRQEHRTIIEHATKGAKILEHIDTFQHLLPGIRHHHERWDGRGFPDKLAGDRIPLLARVLAVADSFDAMTSDRPYRARLSRAAAIAEIGRCAGSQFDPLVVDAFLAIAGNGVF